MVSAPLHISHRWFLSDRHRLKHGFRDQYVPWAETTHDRIPWRKEQKKSLGKNRFEAKLDAGWHIGFLWLQLAGFLRRGLQCAIHIRPLIGCNRTAGHTLKFVQRVQPDIWQLQVYTTACRPLLRCSGLFLHVRIWRFRFSSTCLLLTRPEGCCYSSSLLKIENEREREFPGVMWPWFYYSTNILSMLLLQILWFIMVTSNKVKTMFTVFKLWFNFELSV